MLKTVSKPVVNRLFAADLIVLNNCNRSDFPEGVPINILTREGTISFNARASDAVVGSLNLFNVKVGNKLLRAEDFRQSEDTYESVFTTSDGTPLISVKKI